MNDLKAPLRYRKTAHSDNTFTWLLGLGLALVALVGFEHYQSVQAEKAAIEQQAALETQQRLKTEQIAAAQREVDLTRNYSGSAQTAPESSHPVPRDPYQAERNALEAIEIMHGTRRIQREWDRKQYSDSAPDPVIVGNSARAESWECAPLRSRRANIEARMRDGFRNGQEYRDSLNSIWKEMVTLGCDMRRM
ncbi:hypothetical protein [Solimonas sp. SE-A11]|uniref:hypothetical protein n=1 Tax=Solimonas sp. SE-A11 TaxID=3054954 RepID=UPI00259CDE1F|nr:hypothetical protein [Solimonas sp. SE-A11]MDM4773094.1 hypothetical protein [Solimonas sp. SE-A11]